MDVSPAPQPAFDRGATLLVSHPWVPPIRFNSGSIHALSPDHGVLLRRCDRRQGKGGSSPHDGPTLADRHFRVVPSAGVGGACNRTAKWHIATPLPSGASAASPLRHQDMQRINPFCRRRDQSRHGSAHVRSLASEPRPAQIPGRTTNKTFSTVENGKIKLRSIL